MPSTTAQTIEKERDITAELAAETMASSRTRNLLRAVERYKVVCAARGEEPKEEESWLVLLSALRQETAAEPN
ncbi:MAG TPA: hypothetical protein VHS99_15015 [Chloroflexota bacterium]|jgi:hypothetical protein|nr:hypothetical protein [Chloroflexota bacterium]